jgi:hypothetical protein
MSVEEKVKQIIVDQLGVEASQVTEKAKFSKKNFLWKFRTKMPRRSRRSAMPSTISRITPRSRPKSRLLESVHSKDRVA